MLVGYFWSDICDYYYLNSTPRFCVQLCITRGRTGTSSSYLGLGLFPNKCDYDGGKEL